jgi:hypothetical protein
MDTIIAIEATLTVARKKAKGSEFLLFFTKRFNNATNTNESKKIANVAINALAISLI